MLKTISIILLGIFISIVPAFAQESANSYPESYVLPSSLSFEITEKPKNLQKSIRMSVTIESQIGELKDLNIFFNSSKDIRVMSEKYALKSLKQGEKHVINILAAPTQKEVTNGMGSWLRIGVKYNPDFDALLKVVSDKEKYPHPSLREELINDVKEGQKSKEPFIDAVRHFIK